MSDSGPVEIGVVLLTPQNSADLHRPTNLDHLSYETPLFARQNPAELSLAIQTFLRLYLQADLSAQHYNALL